MPEAHHVGRWTIRRFTVGSAPKSATTTATAYGLAVCVAVALVLCSGAASADAEPIMSARAPSPSPDGKAIAFSYMGDIWTVPSEGGRAHRLTVHEDYDDAPAWSPDGRTIAFTSDREGNSDVYIVPAGGGTPKKLTCHSSWDNVECWTRDGDAVLFTSYRDTVEMNLYSVPIEGGMPRTVITDRAYNPAVSPDGRWIAYVRGMTPWWRKHYRGSASRDIWIRSYSGGPSYKLTDFPGDDDAPMWSADGRSLYFMSERDDAVMNIWRVDLNLPGPGSDAPPAVVGGPVQITSHSHDGVQFASVSGDGSVIVYEWDAGVWALAIPDGEPMEVEILAPSDLKWSPHRRTTMSNELTEFALNADESELALVVHGEVYVCSFKDGETGKTMRITETPAREKDVAWLDDGETLLYASDAAGDYDIYSVKSTEEDEKELSKALKRETVQLTDSEEDDFNPVVSPDGETIGYYHGDKYLWLMDADGGGKKELLPDAEILHFAWSPDSKWIALSRTTMAHKEDIFILSVADGEAVNISDHPNDDFQPLWTDDGKRLSFASRTDDGQYLLKYLWLTREDFWKTDEEREEDEEEADEDTEEAEEGEEDDEPEGPEVRIDFDGINERTVSVVNVRGGYDFYGQTRDGKYFAFRSSALGNSDLWLVDWKGEHLTQVTEGGADPRQIYWSNDGSTCYYVRSGGTIATATIDPESGSVSGRGGVGFSVRLTVDLPEERRQMFNEAWRMLLNGFYDPEFHGVDWRAMRDKYEPLALAAYTEEEFRLVVREMLGELSASHLGIYRYGDGGVSTGVLGVYHDEHHTGPGIHVRAVVPDGPAERGGIVPGEYIVSIDGERVGADDNFYCLLEDTVDEEILVEVAKSSQGKDSRELRIRPVSGGRLRRLVYEELVRENRRKVDEWSDGRIGYIHIPGMGVSNLFNFEEDLFAQGRGKDGLIIDIRGNGGGSVHDQILRFLDRRRYGYTVSRSRPMSYNPLELYTRPLALVIDESCYSDAEIFPMGWKALELGPVVGTPTFGAVIGTNDLELIDGTMFRVPGSGWFEMDGTNLENQGVEPDIRVDAVPEERRATGSDVQLEAAVDALLAEMGR